MVYGIYLDTEHYCDIIDYPNQTEEQVKELLAVMAEDTIHTYIEDGYVCIVYAIAKDGRWANLEFQKPDGSDQFYISLELASKKNKHDENWELVS